MRVNSDLFRWTVNLWLPSAPGTMLQTGDYAVLPQITTFFVLPFYSPLLLLSFYGDILIL